MNITYFEKERIFKLDTPIRSSCIVDEENFIHTSTTAKDCKDMTLLTVCVPRKPHLCRRQKSAAPSTTASHLNIPQQDWGITGKPPVHPDLGRRSGCNLSCSQFPSRILEGKPQLEGLPATFADKRNSYNTGTYLRRQSHWYESSVILYGIL